MKALLESLCPVDEKPAKELLSLIVVSPFLLIEQSNKNEHLFVSESLYATSRWERQADRFPMVSSMSQQKDGCSIAASARNAMGEFVSVQSLVVLLMEVALMKRAQRVAR